MAIKISFNNGIPETPTFVLAKRNGDKLGVIQCVAGVHVDDTFTGADAVSFSVYKELNSVECSLWNQINNFKLVWCKEWNKWFDVSVDINESSSTVKNIVATQLGNSELSQINVYDLQINTEDDIKNDAHKPTVFYDPDSTEYSLLHRVLSKAPHYTICHVDSTLANIQRTFTFNSTSIADAFSEIAAEIGCVFIYEPRNASGDGITRCVSVYDLEQVCNTCGYRGEFENICPECHSTDIHYGYGDDTGVFISTDNLTDEISYSTNASSIKNCFKLTGGDDLMTAVIRSCNMNGSSYIWYFNEAMKNDMSQALADKLDDYDELYNDYYTRTYSPSQSILTAYNNVVGDYLFSDAWVSGNVYNIGDKVTYDYATWESMTQNNAFTPGTNASWQKTTPSVMGAINGYSELIGAQYDVMDFKYFLNTSLMPTIQLINMTPQQKATELANMLSPLSGDPDVTIAVKNPITSGTSVATVTSSITNMVRAIGGMAYFTYEVTADSSSGWDYNTKTWRGRITVTSLVDTTQSATTRLLTLVISDDYQNYIEQVVQRKIADRNTKDMSISGLFTESIEDLIRDLKMYSLDYLSMLSDCCNDALNVFTEAGYSTPGETGYTELYQKYMVRKIRIEEEMNARSLSISYVENMENEISRLITEAQSALDFESYLGQSLWYELNCFRREQEYSNSNFISDGLSNATLVANAKDFIDKAKKELYKSAELQHSVSTTLHNLLVIPEFSSLVDSFCVGNRIRIRVDDSVHKLRLMGYSIDYNTIPTIQVDFSDVQLISTGLTDLSSVVKSVGSISSTYSYVSRQANNGSEVASAYDKAKSNGLDASVTKIIDSSEAQNLVIDQHGALFRKYDNDTGLYEDEQIKIINSTIAFTADNWESAKTAIGKFYYYDPESQEYSVGYGINGEVITGKLLLGNDLTIFNGDNTVKINSNGIYVTNGTNTFTVNPNSSGSILAIVKGSGESAEDVISFDASGNATFKGSIVADSLSAGGKTSASSAHEGLYISNDGSLYGGENNEITINKDGTFSFAGGDLTYAVDPNDTSDPPRKILSAGVINGATLRGEAIDIRATYNQQSTIDDFRVATELVPDPSIFGGDGGARPFAPSLLLSARSTGIQSGDVAQSNIFMDYSGITIQTGLLDIDCSNMMFVNGIDFLGYTVKGTYTTIGSRGFDQNSGLDSQGSNEVVVSRYGNLCIVEGCLTPSAASTSAAKMVLDSTKVPPRAYGGRKWINVPNSNRPSDTSRNALALYIDEFGGLYYRYGGPYRYDFQYIYFADWS